MWGNITDDDVLQRLRQYLQASSALSFAAHAQEFTDDDLRHVRLLAGDYVRMSKLRLWRFVHMGRGSGWRS